MKRLKNTKRMTAVFLLALMLVLCIMPGSEAFAAGNKPQKTIRISYGYNDFLDVDEDGIVTGHYANYLNKLAELNHWKYEYIKTTWTEANRMLLNGEVDFLFPINYLEEREETMDYTAMPVAYTATGLFAMEDSGFHYGDYDSFEGVRIAIAKGSSNETELREFAQKNGFTYQTVYLKSNAAMMQAVQNGDVDLAVFSAANEFAGGMMVATMEAKPVYFTVKKGNTELLEELNSGMQIILKTELDLVEEVYQKSLLGNNAAMVAMTEEEWAFINSGKPVVVGFYEETEPLTYVKADGSYDGLYIEMLNYVKEKTGLNIQLYLISRTQNFKELLKDGTIDFYVGASEVIVSKDDELKRTDSFMDYSNILVTRADCEFMKLESPVIALTYGRANWAEKLEEYIGKETKIVYYRNAKECMIAVLKGEVNASVVNNLEFNYQSKNDRLSSLLQWQQYRFPTEVCCAASTQADEVMFSTFNKALGVIQSGYVDMLTEEWLSIPYHSYTVEDRLYNARHALMGVAIGLAAIVVILFMIGYFYGKQAKIERKMDEEKQRQLRIFAALSKSYGAVFCTDLDTGKCEPLQLVGKSKERVPKADTHEETMAQYIKAYVLEKYQDNLMPYCKPETIIERFRKEDEFSLQYETSDEVEGQRYFEMHFVDISKDESEHKMVFGVRCIDDIVRKEMEQQKLLQDALDGANRANVAKTEFLSRMSHDIRTPMNAIIGMTAIAENHVSDPDKVSDSLKKISAASRHLLGLINDVLDMSKIESGKLSLAEENINLPELINNMLEMMSPRIKEHKHKLNVRVKDVTHEKIIGDSLRIQQVFVNLMGNAVKYTPDGGEITLTVREKPVETPMVGCYEFIFADNGIGMTKEVQKTIFEPFSRAEDLRISKIQGTGLGLSITRNIVQMMNGTVQVESEPGKGSTFTVTMFLKLQESSDEDISELEGRRVLVVDDSEDACDSVSEILRELGIQCDCCRSGAQAVEKVRQSLEENVPYYTVILDWQMPSMDGIETARKIRKLAGEQISMVILSAYDWSDIEEKAREVGVKSFISKPVFQSSIIRMFKNLKDGRIENTPAKGGLNALSENHFENKRILLVEDNMMNREIAVEVLEIAKLLVEEAEDGQEAVEKFSASAPGYYDLILMDIQMPRMNGYEATRAIRALEREDASKIPIIAMTANAFVEDIQDAKDAGMNEHLAKPIDFDKLNAILTTYLSEK